MGRVRGLVEGLQVVAQIVKPKLKAAGAIVLVLDRPEQQGRVEDCAAAKGEDDDEAAVIGSKLPWLKYWKCLCHPLSC